MEDLRKRDHAQAKTGTRERAAPKRDPADLSDAIMSHAQRQATGDGANMSGTDAFLGSATRSVAGAEFVVHVLCWPIVPAAWRSLAQAWESVGGWRSGDEATAKPKAESWIADCAPQFGSPFRGTAAEESTVAAILTRTAMSIAVSAFDGAQSAGANQRHGLFQCLSRYDKYINVPGRHPCRVLVSRTGTGPVEQECADAFTHCRERLPDAEWLQRMELRGWNEPFEPLPLEAAHVIATSVARYRADKEAENPIVDAIRAKLAHPLELLARSSKKRR